MVSFSAVPAKATRQAGKGVRLIFADEIKNFIQRCNPGIVFSFCVWVAKKRGKINPVLSRLFNERVRSHSSLLLFTRKQRRLTLHSSILFRWFYLSTIRAGRVLILRPTGDIVVTDDHNLSWPPPGMVIANKGQQFFSYTHFGRPARHWV